MRSTIYVVVKFDGEGYVDATVCAFHDHTAAIRKVRQLNDERDCRDTDAGIHYGHESVSLYD